jgi:surfactin synthase thioesterase subunit
VVTPDEAAAWRDLTTGDFALAVFPGDHFYLRTGNPAVLDHLLRAVGQR